jgi:hypothetical protein
VYLLGGFLFPGNYVLSTVVVVVLLAMDFWTCRVSALDQRSLSFIEGCHRTYQDEHWLV